jgi:hypothetical protein
MKPNNGFKQPIIRQRTRILRPNEFQSLLDGCPKIEFKTMIQALLYTGMRYIELKRFQQHPEWYDGDFIHLPREAVHKDKRTQQERWVRLNNQGRMIIQYFIKYKKKLPSYQSMSQNLSCWALRAGFPEAKVVTKKDKKGNIKKTYVCPVLTSKTFCKTWESWLMFCYPQQIAMITLSQGHTTLTSLQHYVNMPFTEADRIEIMNFIQGWMPNDSRY